jgi:hypothetical protein
LYKANRCNPVTRGNWGGWWRLGKKQKVWTKLSHQNSDQDTTTVVADHGGTILRNSKLCVIFWGSQWNESMHTNISKSSLSIALKSLCSGPYFSGLSQYRNIHAPRYTGDTINTTTPIQQNATDVHITSVIIDSITRRTVGDFRNDSSIFYIVIPQRGYKSSDTDGDSYHTVFSYGGKTGFFGYVNNLFSSTIDYLTMLCSHEIVETITDPDDANPGFTGKTNSGGEIDEICDLCSDKLARKVNGVKAAAYYSNRDRCCIVPRPTPSV